MRSSMFKLSTKRFLSVHPVGEPLKIKTSGRSTLVSPLFGAENGSVGANIHCFSQQIHPQIDPNSATANIINPFDLSFNPEETGVFDSNLKPEASFPNLKMTVPQDLSDHLQAIVSNFDNLSTCFGYGSGVFPQTGNSTKASNQIDLLMSVENPVDWHKLNIKKFPHHYSTMKYFINIPPLFEKIQGLGAELYFNPFTQIHGSEVKYGVMSHSTLLTDLKTWKSFYVAGRLQKPVMNLTPFSAGNSKRELETAYWMQRNLIAAALLAKQRSISRYGTKFTDFQFFTELCTLSYLGDIRFKLGGENPQKCANIVSKNLENFKILYRDILNEVMLMDDAVSEQYLPQGFTLNGYEQQLETRIAKTSIEQAVKGVFTAGVWKSCKYAWAKKMKAMSK